MKFRPKIIVDRGIYRPQFRGYWYVRAMTQIIDGIIELCLLPFGKKECILHIEFIEWNIMNDLARSRKERNERRR
jgi:hypothetical protein